MPDTVTVAVTVEIEGDVAEAGGGEGGAGEEVTSAEEETDELVAVFPVAAAWKASNLSPGLIAKTIPC